MEREGVPRSPKNDRVFWHTGLIHVDPGCLMGRIKTIGFSGGYPWFSHFHARSQCTWHCGRLQEPCSWGSRQTWRWIYGGSMGIRFQNTIPYGTSQSLATVDRLIRNKQISSIFIHRMQWNAPIPWKKTVEPSETANKLLFLGHCWTSQVLMPGLGPKITTLPTCTVQMTWIKLSFQNPKFRPCSFTYHISHPQLSHNFRKELMNGKSVRNSWTANRLPVAAGRFHEAPIASRICCESCWPRKELMTPNRINRKDVSPKKYTNWVIGCLNPSNGFMNPSIWHVNIIQYPMVHHHGLGQHSHVWDTVTTFGNCPSSCMVPVINSDFKRDNPKSQIFTCHGIFEAGMQQVSFLWGV